MAGTADADLVALRAFQRAEGISDEDGPSAWANGGQRGARSPGWCGPATTSTARKRLREMLVERLQNLMRGIGARRRST